MQHKGHGKANKKVEFRFGVINCDQNLRLQSFGQIVYIFRSSITYFKKSNYLIRAFEISFE